MDFWSGKTVHFEIRVRDGAEGIFFCEEIEWRLCYLSHSLARFLYVNLLVMMGREVRRVFIGKGLGLGSRIWRNFEIFSHLLLSLN